jgi:hypothetical protein
VKNRAVDCACFFFRVYLDRTELLIDDQISPSPTTHSAPHLIRSDSTHNYSIPTPSPPTPHTPHKHSVPEPGCLTGIKQFDPKGYLQDTVQYYRKNLPQLRTEFLSGVTLALIEVPESIAFAFMAGLSPYFGMASVFWVGTLTGLFGGR